MRLRKIHVKGTDQILLRASCRTRTWLYRGMYKIGYSAEISTHQTPRRIVRAVMHEHYPSGFDLRFPGKTKKPIRRVPLFSLGPFHEVSADGHEKIGQQALMMGDIGLPIYAYKDKWSDTLCFMKLVRDARKPGPIGHVYLDFVTEIGGQYTPLYVQTQ